MELSVEDFNITVLGRFNRHIVEPEWAVGHGVIANAGCDTFFNPAGGSPIHRLPSGMCWTVPRDRLVVFGGQEEAPGFVERLLKTLPHTPITAIGVNFQYPINQESAILTRAQSLTEAMDAEPIAASESRIYLLENVRLTIKVDWADTGAKMTANFHLDSRESETVIEHAKRTAEFRDLSRKVLEKLS